MLNQTKYILVIIAILILILYFINDSKIMNNVKDNFQTVSQSLNRINNRCNPVVLGASSNNSCDCSRTSYHNKYAAYDSNDNKTYDVIAKCNLGDNQWRWRAVGTNIRYNHSNYTNCSKSGMENYHLYACKPNKNSSNFSLWDKENGKWVA
jgi:hypothetical protein